MCSTTIIDNFFYFFFFLYHPPILIFINEKLLNIKIQISKKDKVWKSVQGWKSLFFSIAGKEILIKSVGQAISSYVMSVFKISKRICDEITKSFARFWWGTKENKRKMHWCS